MTLIKNAKPGLSPEQVAAFEADVGLPLPEGYREFVAKYDGGVPQPQVVDIGSSDTLVDGFVGFNDAHPNFDARRIHGAMATRFPKGHLAVALDAGGNFLLLNCIATSPNCGGVYFWDHEEESERNVGANLTLIAPSFSQLLSQFHD